MIGMFLLLLGCATHQPPALSLRDPRLPAEARRWLADAEDEVAIASARVEDAERNLQHLRGHRQTLATQLHALSQPAAAALLANTLAYADARIDLAEYELGAARVRLALSAARLDQSRAEAAVRHDIAVRDIEPIARQVGLLEVEVGQAERDVEAQRAGVEAAADRAWAAYGSFVAAGGDTAALWALP